MDGALDQDPVSLPQAAVPLGLFTGLFHSFPLCEICSEGSASIIS